MDLVYPKIFQRLDGDATLGGFIQEVSQRTNPDEPKFLSNPFVTIHTFGGVDAEDLHGAAIDIQCEIKIWAYGESMIKNALRAATRIDELLLTKLTLPVGNFIGRFRPITGWQDTDTADPKLIHLQNQYSARYWVAGKISVLTS